MDILFRQNALTDNAAARFSTEQCMLKRICSEKDRSRITNKSHYHTYWEIHLIEKGFQVYQFGETLVKVSEGQFLFIPPLVMHRAIELHEQTLKYAFILKMREEELSRSISLSENSYYVGAIPEAVKENLERICLEREKNQPYYELVVQGRVCESVLLIMRAAGLRDDYVKPPSFDENERFLLAKQYIEDNSHRAVSVTELANYCYISTKQLERIFLSETGESVMKYARKKRCKRIEVLLSDPALSLRQISESMGFSSEYYFNAYFKKNAGMTPGAYRRSVLKL